MARYAEGYHLTKKIQEICSDPSSTQQILMSALPTDARFIIPSIHWCRNTYISFNYTFIYLSISLPQLSPPISASLSLFIFLTLIKKKKTFSSYARKFRRDRVRSHRWLTASSYMTKYLRIFSYMTLHPIPSEFPYVWGKFSFLFNSAPSLSLFRSKGKIFA